MNSGVLRGTISGHRIKTGRVGKFRLYPLGENVLRVFYRPISIAVVLPELMQPVRYHDVLDLVMGPYSEWPWPPP